METRDPSTPSPSPSSRDAILESAEHLFARQGLTGTTIQAIGGRSGTNTALLYYYFQNKEGLYRACLTRLIEGFATQGTARLGDASPEEAVTRIVAHQAAWLTEHPNLLRLMVRELLDHEGAVVGPVFREVLGGVFTRFAALIRRGQVEKRFRPELDPDLAAISVIAQVVYFLLARPALQRVLTDPDAPPAETLPLEQFQRHAAAFALAALTLPSPPASSA